LTTLGEMSSMAILVETAKSSLKELLEVYQDTMKTTTGVKRAFDLMDTTPGMQVHGKCLLNQSLMRGQIEFKDVTMVYPMRPTCLALKNFNLRVNAGQITAICGSSGAGKHLNIVLNSRDTKLFSGKSTISRLILRQYDPIEGGVFVDGINVRDIDWENLHSCIGVVSQDPILFSASVRENITFGMKSATDANVIRASKIANAHDFISALDCGYETGVGEGGKLLSGGQKQRIAIARAIIRNPRILIFDEATSALDSENERLVLEAINKASVGRTTLVIAHRLSTLRNADNIVILREGTVISQGSHDELVAQGGYYADLVSRFNTKDEFTTADKKHDCSTVSI
jgi:ABC-type multidrug transport system fused ATPase/permease subunit